MPSRFYNSPQDYFSLMPSILKLSLQPCSRLPLVELKSQILLLLPTPTSLSRCFALCYLYSPTYSRLLWNVRRIPRDKSWVSEDDVWRRANAKHYSTVVKLSKASCIVEAPVLLSSHLLRSLFLSINREISNELNSSALARLLQAILANKNSTTVLFQSISCEQPAWWLPRRLQPAQSSPPLEKMVDETFLGRTITGQDIKSKDHS